MVSASRVCLPLIALLVASCATSPGVQERLAFSLPEAAHGFVVDVGFGAASIEPLREAVRDESEYVVAVLRSAGHRARSRQHAMPSDLESGELLLRGAVVPGQLRITGSPGGGWRAQQLAYTFLVWGGVVPWLVPTIAEMRTFVWMQIVDDDGQVQAMEETFVTTAHRTHYLWSVDSAALRDAHRAAVIDETLRALGAALESRPGGSSETR